MAQNLENIKVGDTVIFSLGGWYHKVVIDKVTKVTPKQFEVGTYRFWKKDGSMVGDAYRSCRLATEEDIENREKERHRISLRNTISQFFKYFEKVNSLTNEDMEYIVNIIKKYEK